MQAIPRRQANDAVYEELLENIKSGRWARGEKLPSEYELCEMLQVSRATIRTALQRLKALGLIEVKHGKGSYVLDSYDVFKFAPDSLQLSLTKKEFSDISVLRQIIEPKAIELALKRNDAQAVKEARTAYEDMAESAKTGDLEEFSRQDCRFHLALLLASGNELFIQIAGIFKEQFFRYFYELNKFMLKEIDGKTIIAFDPDNPEDPHAKIYKALCEMDTDSAVNATQDILLSNRQRYEANLELFPDELK